MWSLISRMGSPEPKMMQKGSYHTSIQMGPCFTPIIADKQFSYYKDCRTPTYHPNQNYTTTNMNPVQESNPSRQITITNPEVQNRLCNNNNNRKKKKRRRRRRKKSKTACPENKPQRRRQVSESEDGFVIFFDDDERNSDDEETGEFSSWESIIPRKKVRFVEEDKLCEVHPMVAWSFAYHAARKGPWEECARDRDRFRNRIFKTEALISHVFAEEHRSKIYKQRFVL